jgi:hypothetical protein
MTEAEWLACTSVEDLLHFANYGEGVPSARSQFLLDYPGSPFGPDRPSPRQLALAVVGWADQVGKIIYDEATIAAVRLLLLGADGAVGPHAVAEFRGRYVTPARPFRDGVADWAHFILWSNEEGPLPVEAAGAIADALSRLLPQSDQCHILRDILGNPSRPVSFSSSWGTDTVLALARGMYESRDFGAMPILADALMDAGCENADVLNHCRGGGVHVRGCWVVDLLLGKG